jgi:cytochrome bd-I ubiquinol oxidase subunit X
MWYFTWMLGLAMAILFAVLNAMWYEAQECAEQKKQ